MTHTDTTQILNSIKFAAVGPTPQHWTVRSIDDLIDTGVLDRIQDGNHGESHPVASDYVHSGVPFLMSGDIRNGRVQHISNKFLTPEHARSLRIGHARRGDVLLTHKGNDLGRTAILTDVDWAVLTPQITYYRILQKDRLCPQFLLWVFASPSFQHQFKRDSQQSTRPFVSITNQRTLYIPVPPIDEQRQIANILGTLADKIELNLRMNETLEAMARRLFKSWFIDFDPVHAKAALRREHPKLSNADLSRRALPNMALEIAELFPDSFEDSTLGPIPKGWKVDEIGNLVTVLGGGTPSTKSPQYWVGGAHPFCTPKDMAGLESPVLLHTERQLTDAGVAKVSSGQLPIGTVLLSSRAPIGYLAISHVPVTVNQGIIAMICDDRLPSQYVLHWARTNDEAIVANANGSTFLEISKRNFRPLPVVVPHESIAQSFQLQAADLHEAVARNLRESRELTACRDKLLPRLLSGNLSVQEVH